VNEAGLGMTKRECEDILRTGEFQKVLRTERNKFFKELANDPSRNRNVAVGQLLFAIQNLLDSEHYDKAVSAIAQLFKAEGWTSDGAAINIFNELKGSDIQALRDRLRTQDKKMMN
jgi:hypothetical protein